MPKMNVISKPNCSNDTILFKIKDQLSNHEDEVSSDITLKTENGTQTKVITKGM